MGCKKQQVSFPVANPTQNEFSVAASKLGITLPSNSLYQMKIRYGTARNWERYINAFKQRIRYYPETVPIANPETSMASGPCTKVYKVTIYESDYYNGRTFNVCEGTYIIDALEEQGYQFSGCDRAGVGSACVAKLVSGSIDQSDQTFLSDCQIEAGFVLPCVAYATSDCSLIMNQDENLYQFNPNACNAGNGSNGGGGGGPFIITHSAFDGVVYTPAAYPGKDINLPWMWWVNPQLSPVLAQEVTDLLEEKAEEYNDSQTPCHATKRLGNVFHQGTLEHWLIQLDYINRYGGEREYSIPYAGESGNRPGYADLAKPATKELFEIKPDNPAGQAAGDLEITNYVAKAQMYCPTSGGAGSWHKGTTYAGTSLVFPGGTLKTLLYADGVIVYDHEPTVIRPVVVPATVLDKLKKLLKELVDHPGSSDVILASFCQHNPDVVAYIKSAAVGTAIVLVVGTLVEDILTAGAGIADDWPCFVAGYKLVRFALVL